MDILLIGAVSWNLFIDVLNYRDLFLVVISCLVQMVLFWSDLKIEIFEGFVTAKFLLCIVPYSYYACWIRLLFKKMVGTMFL
jgi:hypothetical protein